MNRYLLFITLGIVLLTGCGKQGMYHLEVKNNAQNELNRVNVKFDDFDFTFGVLISGAMGNNAFVGEKHPLPSKMNISWVTMDGKKYNKIVDIKSNVPALFDEIRINLNIDDNNDVTVKWVNDPTYK